MQPAPYGFEGNEVERPCDRAKQLGDLPLDGCCLRGQVRSEPDVRCDQAWQRKWDEGTECAIKEGGD